MGDSETKRHDDTPQNPSLTSQNSQSFKTVIAVMTGDGGDSEALVGQELLKGSERKVQLECEDIDETPDGIAIPPSDMQEAMAQIIIMKKENDEDMIEVDVELDGEGPPPEFFLSDDSHIDEVMHRKILDSFSQNVDDNVVNTDENGESVDVICGKCGKHFNNINALQWHLKLHARIKKIIAESSQNRHIKNKPVYECPECQITFSKSNELVNHRLVFHVNKQHNNINRAVVKCEVDKDDVTFTLADDILTCEFCEDIFSDVDVLQQHVENDHAGMIWEAEPVKQCENGGQNFTSVNMLQRHLESSSCETGSPTKQTIVVSLKDDLHNMTTSPHCSQTFSSVGSLRNHMKADHNADNMEEGTGDIVENNDFELLEVTDAAEDKPLIIQIIKESNLCKSCDKSFLDFAELQKHELTHAQDKTYTCEECGEELPTYFSLLRHTRMQHVYGETEILICKKCGRSFTNEEDLEDHIQDHSTNSKRKKYRCTVCHKTFTHKHSLKNHMPLHNGMGKHKCPECNKLFPCASSLNRHIKIHSSEKQFVCEECDKAFKDAYALKKHLRIHSSDRPYVCQECGASFRTQSTLSAHTVVHTKIKPFPCEQCGKKFSFRSDLNRHVKLHSGVRPHQCDLCPKAFFEKSRLVIHRRIHTGEKPFACSECNETFISSRNLARHMKNHNPTFICTICSKTYVDAYTLKIHTYKHTGERPHACSHCPKRFRTPALLKKHELTHTGIKPYICDSCGRGFTSALNLKNHTTLHTGERPFQCLQCNKCFPTESTLKVHMQFHGEKAYFCDKCGKSFHRVYELKLHAITHAPQKPFSCELCNRSFCHKATYKAHMNTHTEETKYPCPQCKKIFLRSNTLRKHMKTHGRSQSREQANDDAGFAQPEYYEESYLCTECGNTFTDINVLRKHLTEEHDAIAIKEETELVVEEVAEAQVVEART